MDNKKSIVPIDKQSNVITMARYNYTLIEKRIIYHILIQIKKNNLPDTDLKIKMQLHELTKDSKIEHVKKSCIKLRQRSFIIKNNESWLETGFISYSIIEKGYLTVKLSEHIMPYLLNLDKNFTRLNISIASNLRSIYTQRLYEICCRFRDTGKYITSIDELRKIMMLEDKYSMYASLKQRVLEPAQKELKELYEKNEVDIMFTYEPHKSGKQVIEIQFNIKNKEKNKGSLDLTTDERQKVMDYLKWVYPENNRNKWRDHVYRALDKKKGLIDFVKKVDEISNRKKYKGKSPGSWAAVVTHSLRQDFSLEI